MQVPFEDAVALGMRTAAVIVERWSHPLQQREGGVSRGLPEGWHNHEGYRQIFCAALSGITANPNFFGSLYQQAPSEAVKFARDVVTEAIELTIPTPEALPERG